MTTLCSSLLALALLGSACANPGTTPPAPSSTASGEQPQTAPTVDEARSWLRRGDADRALALTDRILAANPNDRTARLVAAQGNLAIADEGRSNTESLLVDAATNFERALELDEADPDSWFALADVHLKLGAFAEGSAAAQKAAAQWREAGAKDKAADAMLRAADNELQAFVELRRAEMEAGEAGVDGNVPAAEETAIAAQRVLGLCNGAVARRPGGSHTRAATVRQWLGDQLGALDELERGVLAAPNDAGVHNALLNLRWSLGQHREAVGSYQNFIKQSSAPILHWHLGRAQFGLADHQRQRSESEQAARSYAAAAVSFETYGDAVPAHAASASWWRALASLSMARLSLENGDLERAEAQLAEAYDIDPRVAERDANGYPLIYHSTFGNTYEGDLFRIGTTYAQQGGTEGLTKALEFFTRINDKHPRKFGQFYNNAGLAARDLGASLAAQGETAKAQELWERSYADYCVAVDLVPDDPRIVNDCGLMLIYHLHRDYDRARALFDQAIEVGTPMFEALTEDSTLEERNFVEEALGDAYQNVAVLMAQLDRPYAEMKPFLEKAVTFYPYQRRESARMLRRGNSGEPVLGRAAASPAGAAARGSAAGGGAAGSSASGAVALVSNGFRPQQDPQDPRLATFEKKVAEAEARAVEGDFDGALLVMDRMAKEMKGLAPFHFKCGIYNFEYAKQKRDSGGDVGLVSGLFEDAKRQLQQAIEADSEPFSPRAALGEVQFETGDYGAAVTTASSLILHMSSTGKATPADLQGAHRLKANAAARSYIAAKQNGQDASEALTDARTSFKLLSEQKALDEAGYTTWGSLEEWAGAGDQAIAALAAGLAQWPDSQALLGSLVDTGYRTSSSAKVVEALASRDDAAGIWFRGKARFNSAEERRNEADFDKAAEAAAAAAAEFEASMRANPAFTQSCEQWKTFCLAKLASMQLLQKKYDEAEKNVMAALALRPDQIDGFISDDETIKVVFLKVADQYVQKGDLANTERLYRKAVSLVPNDALLANNHGLFARDLADQMRRTGGSEAERAELYEASYASYRKAVDLDPENVRLRNDCALILVYHLQRNWDEAAELLTTGAADGERQLREQDLAGDAKNQLEEATGDCYENLALYHLRHTKDAKAALAAAEKSLEFYPGAGRPGARRHIQAARRLIDGGEK